jgi:hypothetical protein
VLEFVDKLVHEVEPDARRTTSCAGRCTRLPRAARGLAAVTLAFQLHACGLLGYGLEARVRRVRAPPAGRLSAAGRRLRALRRGRGQVVFASPAALARSRCWRPRRPTRSARRVALPGAGEMLRLVEFHLRSHVARFAGFRSLHLLFSLEGAAA